MGTKKYDDEDGFEYGFVVRWTAHGFYTYAAIKTEIGWVTTAHPENKYVPRILDAKALSKILNSDDVTDVEAATGWVSLSAG